MKTIEEKRKIARNILNELYGFPKTHQQWAERFNQVAKIIKHL